MVLCLFSWLIFRNNLEIISKTAFNKIGTLIRSMKFLSSEVVLYLYQSTVWLCMAYCCRLWAGAPTCYLEFLDKLKKHIFRTVAPSLLASYAPLAHHWDVASLNFSYRYYFGNCLSELAQLVPLPHFREKAILYFDRLCERLFFIFFRKF